MKIQKLTHRAPAVRWTRKQGISEMSINQILHFDTIRWQVFEKKNEYGEDLGNRPLKLN